MKLVKHVRAHGGIIFVISSDKEYVSEEEACAEMKFVDRNVYNNTSMLAGNRTIFANATSAVSNLRQEKGRCHACKQGRS
jgi:hypothetical protein